VAVLPRLGSLTDETAITCVRDRSTGQIKGIHYLQVTSNLVTF
jgi:hypothetical protein